MQQYLDLLSDVMLNGEEKSDRTGTGTRSLFGRQLEFDLREGFPVLTTKKLHWKSIVHELLWFIKGDTNIGYLQENGVRIWDEWADESGDLGPIYGESWRNWRGNVDNVKIKPVSLIDRFTNWINRISYNVGLNPIPPVETTPTYSVQYQTIDQLKNLISNLESDPMSRRHLILAWNPGRLHEMALPPCHAMVQFNVASIPIKDRLAYGPPNMTKLFDKQTDDELADDYNVPKYYLDCKLSQRSADIFLGVPFNIASYSLLMCMIAKELNLVPRFFIWSGGDVHLYNNHIEQATEQLTRKPKPLPRLLLKNGRTIIGDNPYQYEDFVLEGYDPDPSIKAPVAV